MWRQGARDRAGIAVINPATGVLARYYHRYAAYLAANGFDVLTYDYRGIGASRPESLRGCRYRWQDWGTQDFDAALRYAAAEAPGARLLVVGHSIGGYLPGLSPHARQITRLLTVGGQYGYWRDYDRAKRAGLFFKWNIAMPALTALYGYFPGKRLGWLEDLPAGVVSEWSFRRARMELAHRPEERAEILARFAAVTAPILAVTLTDDEFATPRAIARTLRYYRNAAREAVRLRPDDLGHENIGHFGLFHARHAADFWPATLAWLSGGENPWPHRLMEVQG
ncbi:alpha/beta hydrolase family protein [Acidocella aromatica]|uniref:Putative alpha/beta hydrolase n=1 Tax=Acidocella aromatica TaxID=1303579 RepID=A0A840VQ76_9PROT|nr:alpha/beta fold hydrolase [Acidocella aromatica]MBB5372452.1 putative alpha/beta hydrolase [Acidocella aromatica]